MTQGSRHRRDNERGQALLEYALMVALVGGCLVMILGSVGSAAKRAYGESADAISTGKPPARHAAAVSTVIHPSSGPVGTGTAGRPHVPAQPDSAATSPDSVATDQP